MTVEFRVDFSLILVALMLTPFQKKKEKKDLSSNKFAEHNYLHAPEVSSSA